MSNKTLASLALLKATINAGGDYLHYLRPFVLHVLNRTDATSTTAESVANAILHDFGMVIPPSIITIVLRRIAKRNKLRRHQNAFEKLGPLPNPRLEQRQAEADHHINAILSDLQTFSQSTANPLPSRAAAITAVCTFLSRFDITCLRMYLRSTALPPIDDPSDTDILLVSDYVSHLHANSPARFDSFLVVVQGHMLANALTCPDLGNAPLSYKKTTFYMDTPLVVRFLGAEGSERQASSKQLVRLVTQLGGHFALFAHSCDETKTVLVNAAKYIDHPDGRGEIVAAARRGHITKADLHLLAEQFEETLHSLGVQTHPSPEIIPSYEIDEEILEERLTAAIPYFNPNAATYDVRSVRSIYALRRNTQPRSIEAARAVFVTSNDTFASVAWEYGREVEESLAVSSVISDFTLANTAWLKAPAGAPDVPTTQVLAFCYAALQPSRELLLKFLEEADRLEEKGVLTPRDHQLLRSSPNLEGDVMRLTMGSTDAVTEDAVIAARDRALEEFSKEETQKRVREQKEHAATQSILQTERARRLAMVESAYWACRTTAEQIAKLFAYGASLIVLGLEGVSVWQAYSASGTTPWWAVGSVILVDLIALTDFLFGSTLRKLHNGVLTRVQGRLLDREARRLGIDVADFSLRNPLGVPTVSDDGTGQDVVIEETAN